MKSIFWLPTAISVFSLEQALRSFAATQSRWIQMMIMSSKSQSLCWLSQSPILIWTHLHADWLQDLFYSHVSVPIAHSWQLLLLDNASFRVNTVHIDLWHEFHLRRNSRIFFGTVNVQLIEAAIMVGLGCVIWMSKGKLLNTTNPKIAI